MFAVVVARHSDTCACVVIDTHVDVDAVTTCASLCLLADVLAKLQAEADTMLGPMCDLEGGSTGKQQAVTTAMIDRLVYHTAVLKETLRMDTPGPVVSRDCLEADAVTGTLFTIPQGAQVWLSPWLLHRNPRFWESPDTFNPERWIDPSTNTIISTTALPHLFQYLPFSAGRRNCIGQVCTVAAAIARAHAREQRETLRVDCMHVHTHGRRELTFTHNANMCCANSEPGTAPCSHLVPLCMRMHVCAS